MTHRPPGTRGITPQGRGRFPGFDVLGQAQVWDDVTAGVVLARLTPGDGGRFFTDAERAVAAPLLDLLLGQDGEPRVPVLPLVDTRLAIGETDGWHYDDMPVDGQAWRETLAALDDAAMALHGVGFAAIGDAERTGLLQEVQERAGSGTPWHGWSASRVWSLWTRYACTAFYSHPWAWNEIGFPGPAYPRGYLHLGVDARDRWEVADSDSRDPVVGTRNGSDR